MPTEQEANRVVKAIIDYNIRIINDSVKFSVSKADVADQQKKADADSLIKLKERMMQIQVGFASIKNTPAPPKPTELKPYRPLHWYVAVLFLAATLGNFLGFAIFTFLEHTL